MKMAVQTTRLGWRNICQVALMTACLSSSLVILWGESQSGIKKSVAHGNPLLFSPFAPLALLFLSFGFLKQSPKSAIYGIAVAVWTLFTCAVPTL